MQEATQRSIPIPAERRSLRNVFGASDCKSPRNRCVLATASPVPSSADHARKMADSSTLTWQGSDKFYSPYIGKGEVLFTGEQRVNFNTT